MIRHIELLDYYAIDFTEKSYHFWTSIEATRALRKWLKSKSKNV